MANTKGLANELAKQRAIRGWTLIQLATISKVSRLTIFKIEHEQCVAKPRTLVKLARALCVEEDLFLKYIIR